MHGGHLSGSNDSVVGHHLSVLGCVHMRRVYSLLGEASIHKSLGKFYFYVLYTPTVSFLTPPLI